MIWYNWVFIVTDVYWKDKLFGVEYFYDLYVFVGVFSIRY